ncbi:hypothetical protein ACN2A0_04155 [Aerococcus viridans]
MTWNQKKNEFHHDFNNFALCLYYQIYLNKVGSNDALLSRIEENILKSRDSPHYTINWLPMILFTLLSKNALDYSITRKLKIKRIIWLIERAINQDFVFEDRLPIGKSMNLQYNISTIAGLGIISDFF